MSYIRMDKALTSKPKFRRIQRETGLDLATLIGHLYLIWAAVDELGEEFIGSDEDIAAAVSAPVCALCAQNAQTAQTSALFCAMEKVGWAERLPDGIRFFTNDDSARERSEAHRARAKRSYERRKDDSARFCAESAGAAQSAPPPSLSSPERDEIDLGDASLGKGEEDETDQTKPTREVIEMVAGSPRKAKLLTAINEHCRPCDRTRLVMLVHRLPEGEYLWDAYAAARDGASKAKSKGAYWRKCIENIAKQRR